MSDPSSDPDREGGRDDGGRDRGSDGRRHDSDGHDPDADGRRRDGTLRDPEAGRRRGEPVRQGPKRDRGSGDGDQGRRVPGRRDADSRRTDSRSVERSEVEMYGIDRANPPTADRDDDRTDARASPGSSTVRWLSGVVSVVGLWIAASAAVYDPTTVALWNNVATGGAVFLLAGYGFLETMRGGRPDAESAGLTALLGLWAVVAPLLLTYGSPALVWSTVASGVAVGVLSGFNSYENRRAETAETVRQRG